MGDVVTPDQARDLAARTLAAIGPCPDECGPLCRRAADRERVASDLAGLADCYDPDGAPLLDDRRHARRYADNLRRTARLYGVKERHDPVDFWQPKYIGGRAVTPDQAEAFAARITRAIARHVEVGYPGVVADRENVAYFLRAIQRAEEGLREHAYGTGVLSDECPRCYMASDPCPDARRYTEARDDAWASLQRTAALYGVQP